jgi:Na+/proline symporter
MLGLMLAALFSATASMISSQLNVFSGVLTENIYKPLANRPSEKQLVYMGRVFTVVLGGVVALIAIGTPFMGGAAQMIIGVTQVMVTPLLAPALLALFIPRLGTRTIWATVGICFPLGLLTKFTDVLAGSWMADSTFTGVFLPLIVIAATLLFSRKEAPGWAKIRDLADRESKREHPPSSAVPALIVAISLAAAALTLLILIAFNDTSQGLLAGFSGALFVLSALLFSLSRRMNRKT